MSAAVVARIGRHRQRYQDNFRLVSGCIPYKVTKDDDESSSQRMCTVKVLMVSTPNRNDLVFPKGGWEDDETVEEAACREALEEAGVKGILQDVSLGVWEFRSKSREEISCMEGGCRGYMFALEVTEELDVWPEQGDKSRKWLNVEEARSLCRYDWMREALDRFSELMVKQSNNETVQDVDISPDSGLALHPSDVLTDCGIIPLNCRANPSAAHHSSSREFMGSVGLESVSVFGGFF
uniref:Nudix hydrolase domain-containing protein n=1 Tax=Kalanchoe fedtschenkoi TaxID=63787 RepID=A0A7N0VN34_KALFE